LKETVNKKTSLIETLVFHAYQGFHLRDQRS